MSARRLTTAVAISVAALMVLGSLGLIGVFTPAVGGSPSAAASTATSSSATNPSTSASPSTAGLAAKPGTSAALAEAALALSKQDGIASTNVYVPTADQATEPVSATGGHVEPLYSYAPAPMGLADYGLTNTTGTVSPSLLTTTSVMGTFSTNSTQGIQPLYLDSGVPDGYSVQLNSVLVNVSLNGSTSTGGIANQFWTQNVAFYASQLHQLMFIDNVWSFWPGFTPDTFSSYGPNGTFVYPEYYYAVGPTINISYPFSVGLYLNSTVINGDNAVYFNYTLSNSTVHLSGSYDYVVFNSGGHVTAGKATYQADGYNYNPLGLTNDFEIALGGPGGGSTTDLVYADATFTLQYWNATAGTYQAVPSAYNYGGETGETSNGANVWYTGTTAHMTTGPSILSGLWNATGSPSGNPGFNLLHLDITPSNAFVLVVPAADLNISDQNNGSISPYIQWSPTMGNSLFGATWLSNVIPLMPGLYYSAVLLGGANATVELFNLTSGPGWFNVTLQNVNGTNSNYGTETPIFAWTNAQLAALSVAGQGTSSNPYEINATNSLLDNNSGLFGLFGVFNDYVFPEFPGVWIANTSAYVQISSGSLPVAFPDFLAGDVAYYGIPSYNYLQTWITGATNVELVNSNFEGWFFNENSWADPANVMIFNSGNVLVANSNFFVTATGLFVYNGHSDWDGGGVTVWGNLFVDDTSWGGACGPYSCQIEEQFLGLQLSASGDLVYNNYFTTSTTAWTPTYDWWTISTVYPSVVYTDTWNIPEQPISNVNYAPGFPDFPLSGSIISTSYQGGNYWADYGTYSNPYGVLPYNETVFQNGANLGGLITVGGDYVPLVPYTLYNVTVDVSALAGVPWTIQTSNFFETLSINSGAGPGAYTQLLPNGTYNLVGYLAGAYTQTVTFNVTGTDTSVSFGFPEVYLATFQPTGYQAGSDAVSWQIYAENSEGAYATNLTTTGGPLTLWLGNDTWNYSVSIYSPSTVAPVNYTGSFVVAGAAPTIDIAFEQAFEVTLTASDLPGSSIWWVNAGPLGTFTSNGSTPITFYLGNGTYTAQFATLNQSFVPYSFFNLTQAENVTFTVSGEAVQLSLAFTELFTVSFVASGLPAFLEWNVTFGDLGSVSSWGNEPIQFTTSNGSYDYAVVSCSGAYAPAVPAGTVVVHGADLTVEVAFNATSGFAVTFAETGLPNGTIWVVQFNGQVGQSTGSTISFPIPTLGSYAYQITSTDGSLVPSPSAGTVFATAANTTLNVSFIPPTHSYTVYFTESGAWPGQIWQITLGNNSLNASQPIAWITVAPGVYNFSITPPAGYSSSLVNGTLNVTSDQSIAVTFTLITYSVTFVETGLPDGTAWAVQLGAVVLGSSSDSITFQVAPGSFGYWIGYLSGWAPGSSTGTVTVTNESVTVDVTFAVSGFLPAHVGDGPLLAAPTRSE